MVTAGFFMQEPLRVTKDAGGEKGMKGKNCSQDFSDRALVSVRDSRSHRRRSFPIEEFECASCIC